MCSSVSRIPDDGVCCLLSHAHSTLGIAQNIHNNLFRLIVFSVNCLPDNKRCRNRVCASGNWVIELLWNAVCSYRLVIVSMSWHIHKRTQKKNRLSRCNSHILAKYAICIRTFESTTVDITSSSAAKRDLFNIWIDSKNIYRMSVCIAWRIQICVQTMFIDGSFALLRFYAAYSVRQSLNICAVIAECNLASDRQQLKIKLYFTK